MICSPSKSLLIAAFCLITLPGVHPARRVKVEKPRKSIDWNNSYYASRFAPCKKLRILDPVESFKAQAYAAEIFRKCGPKMIVKLGSKYNFPAFGKHQTSETFREFCSLEPTPPTGSLGTPPNSQKKIQKSQMAFQKPPWS